MPALRLRLVIVLALVLCQLSRSAHAETVHEIDWNSLLSAEEVALRGEVQAIQLQIRALPIEQQKLLPRIATEIQVQRQLDRGETSEDQLKRMQRQLSEPRLSEQYPDATRYWLQMEALKQKIAALKTKTNPELIGQRVRLSGYLLPLEFDGGEVSEFLLVPFVGACIHVPPPPPNQIVHVVLDGRYAADSVYAPVTVTGTLSTSEGQVNLFLNDGNAMVDHGYRLKAETVVAGRAK